MISKALEQRIGVLAKLGPVDRAEALLKLPLEELDQLAAHFREQLATAAHEHRETERLGPPSFATGDAIAGHRLKLDQLLVQRQSLEKTLRELDAARAAVLQRQVEVKATETARQLDGGGLLRALERALASKTQADADARATVAMLSEAATIEVRERLTTDPLAGGVRERLLNELGDYLDGNLRALLEGEAPLARRMALAQAEERSRGVGFVNGRRVPA